MKPMTYIHNSNSWGRICQMQKHFLLLFFSEQGGADCGGPLSAAAQTHRICPETDERSGPEMEG